MEIVGMIIVGLVIALVIDDITDKESSRALLYMLVLICLILYDVYNEIHDQMYNWYDWYDLLIYLVAIAYLSSSYSTSYFVNKDVEDDVLNALLQFTNKGEKKINPGIIASQVNVSNYKVSLLFDIFKSSGEIPYDVELEYGMTEETI